MVFPSINALGFCFSLKPHLEVKVLNTYMKGALCFFFHLTFVYESDMEPKVEMLFWHHKIASKFM